MYCLGNISNLVLTIPPVAVCTGSAGFHHVTVMEVGMNIVTVSFLRSNPVGTLQKNTFQKTFMKCLRSTAGNTNIIMCEMVNNRFVSGLVLLNVFLCEADCTDQRVGHCCNILYIFFPTSFSSFLWLPNDCSETIGSVFTVFPFFFFRARHKMIILV